MTRPANKSLDALLRDVEGKIEALIKKAPKTKTEPDFWIGRAQDMLLAIKETRVDLDYHYSKHAKACPP